MGFQSSDKHEEKLLVHDQPSEVFQVLCQSFLVTLLWGLEGEEDGMVFASTREEEPHCKGAEVTVGKVLISRNMDQISQVRLELREG